MNQIRVKPILQLHTQWPGLCVETRLVVTLFSYRPHCFQSRVNDVSLILVYIYKRNERGLYQKQGYLQPRFYLISLALSARN